MRVEQDPIHRHKDVLAHTIAVVAKTTPDPPRAHGRAPPRRRQAEDALDRAAGACRSTTTRWSAPAWPGTGCGRCGSPTTRSTPSRQLVYLHLRFHGYGDDVWTDAAVRRYVRDAGPLLDELNELTRCDCTTRNERKAKHAGRPHGRPRGAHRRAPRAGGAGVDPARPRRPGRDGPPRRRAGARWWARRSRCCSRPAWRRAPWAMTRPTAASTRGGPSATRAEPFPRTRAPRASRSAPEGRSDPQFPCSHDQRGRDEGHQVRPASAAGATGRGFRLEHGVDAEVGPAEAREQRR